jgi:hypothetical protein
MGREWTRESTRATIRRSELGWENESERSVLGGRGKAREIRGI